MTFNRVSAIPIGPTFFNIQTQLHISCRPQTTDHTLSVWSVQCLENPFRVEHCFLMINAKLISLSKYTDIDVTYRSWSSWCNRYFLTCNEWQQLDCHTTAGESADARRSRPLYREKVSGQSPSSSETANETRYALSSSPQQPGGTEVENLRNTFTPSCICQK